MTVNVSWDNDEKTVVYLEFIGKLTWEEYDNGVTEAYALMRTVSHPVDIISHMHDSVRIPKDDVIPHVRFALEKRPPNMRKGLLIGKDPFGEAILQAMIKIKGFQEVYVTLPDLEAARAYAAQLGETTIPKTKPITKPFGGS